jgi:hypothetical protein
MSGDRPHPNQGIVAKNARQRSHGEVPSTGGLSAGWAVNQQDSGKKEI